MKRFKKIYIEITNLCNLSCNFCPKTKRELKLMNEASFSHIVEQVKPYTDHIYFHLMGEPFLNPDLRSFLEISYENGLKVNITTNGTLIDQVKEVLLSSPALRQVNLSLSSFEANEHNGTLCDYLDRIINFILEANSRTNVICTMRLWNMDSEDRKGSNQANAEIMRILETGLALPFQLSEKLQETPRLKLRRNLNLNIAEIFEWPDMNKDDSQEAVYCYGLQDHIGILVDGTVVPCCLDSEGNIPLGNIFESSLEEILHSERAQNLCEGFLRRTAVEELCRRCGFSKRFQ